MITLVSYCSEVCITVIYIRGLLYTGTRLPSHNDDDISWPNDSMDTVTVLRRNMVYQTRGSNPDGYHTLDHFDGFASCHSACILEVNMLSLCKESVPQEMPIACTMSVLLAVTCICMAGPIAVYGWQGNCNGQCIGQNWHSCSFE